MIPIYHLQQCPHCGAWSQQMFFHQCSYTGVRQMQWVRALQDIGYRVVRI